MKSGRIIENVKVDETGNSVSFYLYGSPITFPMTSIEKIEYTETKDDSHLETQISTAPNTSSISDEEAEILNDEMESTTTERGLLQLMNIHMFFSHLGYV